MLLRMAEHRVTGGEPAQTQDVCKETLARLRAVVLLAGSVRPSPLRRAIGRFLLELPITAEHSIMDLWHEQLTQTAERFDLPRIPVRVIVDRTTLIPTQNTWNGRCDVQFEQDPLDYRGTGGLLRDLMTQYEPDDYLLIVHAAQVFLEPLSQIAASLASLRADVGIACGADGSPTGIMLIRCGALMSIPAMGFVDLNEQALPAIAKEHDVRVARGHRMGGLPVRSLTDYLTAVRQYHRFAGSGMGTFTDAYDEGWQATFGIIEPGAEVDPSALVHDSVVLKGGRVEAGSILVRALVCPGAVVSTSTEAIDCLVGGMAPPYGREKD